MTQKEQEKQWRAEDDARTITRHAEILADKERYTMAKKHIEDQAAKAAAGLKIMEDYKKSGLM